MVDRLRPGLLAQIAKYRARTSTSNSERDRRLGVRLRQLDKCLARRTYLGEDVPMPDVACQVVRWVADDPQPGFVEAELVDCDGRSWLFRDKVSIFGAELNPESEYPLSASIRCEVLERETVAGGGEVVTISTVRPDGLDSVGVTEFRVSATSVK